MSKNLGGFLVVLKTELSELIITLKGALKRGLIIEKFLQIRNLNL